MSQIQTIFLESVEQNMHYTHGGETRMHNAKVLPEFEVSQLSRKLLF